ncbi:unnamed protein product [Cylindrotheca closterium]|uniref:Uncharacterized protein n=1 Tax=Cylindrotheca closterium TaxID=2856 RepID=A0AAD2CY08_9STRA|nr:unnamed protein product [Cylindrotheca closterium]
MPVVLPDNVEDLMREKYLYKAIEKLDLPRESVNFKQVCDENDTVFGKAGSEERTKLQERWYNIKRCNIRSYAAYLQTLGLARSRTTEQLLSDFRTPSPASTVIDNEKGSTRSEKDSSILEALGNLSISTSNKDEPCKAPPQTIFRTTVTNDSSFFPPPAQKMMQSPVPDKKHQSFSSPTPSVDSSSLSSAWTEANHEGSKHNPVVVNLDLNHAEKNFPFVIESPGRKEDPSGRYEHMTIQVQREILPPDIDKYMMWLEENSLEGTQSLLVQEPSLPSTFHQVDKTYKDDSNSDQAKYANQTKKRIDSDPSRQFRYYRIALPAHQIKLDNSIFSNGCHGRVEMGARVVTYKVNNFDIKTMVVEWTIALAGQGIEKLATPKNPISALAGTWASM